MAGAIPQRVLDAAVWGTGHGSRRHLVDHSRSVARKATPWGYASSIRARCSDYYLSYLDSAGPRAQRVLDRRQPCARCQKLAEAQP